MKTRTVELLQRFRSYHYPIKAEQLALEHQVSQRTIRQDVLDANSWLRAQQLAEIQTIRKKGFLLRLNKEEEKRLADALVAYQEELLNRDERTFDLVLAIAYEQQPIYLNRKEEAFMISKSTMDEDMRRLRADLVKYGIEIVSYGKQGLVYQGAERSIRTMIYDLINKNLGRIDFSARNDTKVTAAQKIFHRYFPLSEIKKLEAIYTNTMVKQEDDIYKNQLLLFTMIWIQRVRKHELISAINWKNLADEENRFSEFIEQVIVDFELTDIPPVERNYLRFTIETFSTKDINNSLEWVQAQLLTIQLIKFVEEQTHIPFHLKEEILCENLYKHMTALIVRIKHRIQVTNPLKENIRVNYGPIYDAVALFVPTIEEVVGGRVIDDELAFLVIHFSTIASSIKQNITYIYKSVVVCNHGVATGNLLAENLKEKFPQIEVVAVLSSKEAELVDKLDVDLIFSTFQLSGQNKPLLVLEPILTDANRPIVAEFLSLHQKVQRMIPTENGQTELFANVLRIVEESGGKIDRPIYTKLETLFEQNHLEINKREIQPMLKDILTDNHILIQEHAENWQEAIERVAKPLLKENIIESSYVDAMVHAVEEYGAYIVIGKHLALAHARPEDGVNKLGVSVATIRQPIAFGNDEMDPVKIIFCLAAVDSYSHLTIMKELIELINDETKLNRLIESSNVDSFKQLLFK
ncbi:PTS sugar transporter subunit IIA [Enterococcus sp. DIV1298c]|uniref:PTS system EIIA component n=1 Tax=Candidatus Enterococcus mangumiae TaxID=2230878 RepID=A0ABZ2T147_9ENTE|nr:MULTISPECIES: PTS sugar transporter subunit IIA [unclassified Enterococcus]MBO0460272.1 PTS sugar transporter subunit IIA [Enterococcus sp. DIV1298c]MBO0490268.1 PTS sugar transporter subunit IIA [Enterococcus sp. DIV1094]